MNSKWKKTATALTVAMALLAGGTGAVAKKVGYGSKDLAATLSHDVVRVGKTVSVLNPNTRKKINAGYSYSSSDSTIAYVNK